MLRASEVRELLEGPAVMPGGEVPPPTMMEGSEPLPPEAAAMMPQAGPTAAQIEESILGSKSQLVDQTPEPEPEPVAPPAAEPPVSSELSAEFSSARYEMEGETPVLEATTIPTPTEEPPAPAPTDTGFAAVEKPAAPEPKPAPKEKAIMPGIPNNWSGLAE